MSPLPAGWVVHRVEDIFRSFSGGTPDRSNPEFWSGKIAWLSSGDIKSASVQTSSEFITREGLENSSAKLCPSGSVLVVVRSGILRHTLPVAILARSAAINQDIKCFDSGNADLNHWLALALKNEARHILALNREGTTVQSVRYETLKRFELRLPPLNEQRRIVATLEELLAKVEDCQKRLAKIPLILKRFRQSVLAAACSGRLTEDWRQGNKNSGSASLTLAESKSDLVRLDRNDLPVSWVRYRLKDLSLLITKGASPKWQGISYASTGVLFVTSENIGWRRMLFDNRKYVEPKFNQLQKRSVLRRGDLLTNIVGASIGRSALYDSDEIANINQAVALVRLDQSLNKHYILNVLNSPLLVERMHEEKVDVARANLSLKDVADFPIPLPPRDEQDEIVRRVEALFELADQIEARYRKARGQVDKLTQSILAKAFRGELVPTEAELARLEGRDYEPASVLLEQIAKDEAISRHQPPRRQIDFKNDDPEEQRGDTSELLISRG